MPRKIKIGTFAGKSSFDLSKEEFRQYRRESSNRYKSKNAEKIKLENHKYWLIYKKTKPCLCQCKYCDKYFNAYRTSCKVCPKCKKEKKKLIEERKLEKIEFKNYKIEMKNKILQMHRDGIKLKTISEETKHTIRSINYIVKSAKEQGVY